MLVHVEVQKVFYVTYRIEADTVDAARELADKRRPGEVVGRKLMSRLVTNAHPITDACTVRGCEQHFPDALAELSEGRKYGGM